MSNISSIYNHNNDNHNNGSHARNWWNSWVCNERDFFAHYAHQKIEMKKE